MKKIMFNDLYGLTEAVLNRLKTKTRRIAPDNTPIGNWSETLKYSRFQIGEVVAIAQSYKDAGVRFLPEEDDEFGCYDFPAEQTNGWSNKMFVRADLMPHHIRITNIQLERLQDISDEDCIKEGIYKDECRTHFNGYAFEIIKDQNGCVMSKTWYNRPRKAFAALIDRISRKGTWDSNPYVFVYDFELVD